MVKKMKNVILLGYGKMGSSIAKGWRLKKLNFNFFVVEKVSNLRKVAIKDGFNAYEDLEQLTQFVKINSDDVIFLAVKPQQMKETIKPLFKLNFKNIVFISIAAGLSISWFQNQINKSAKIVRAMPNLPASIGVGVTGYCQTNNLSDNDINNANNLLCAFGKVIYLSSEKLIDVVTAISGSGPAYIFYLVEVLSKIGKENGLLEQDSKTLALETLIGSAKLLELSKMDPEILKKNVTSPGGTTEAGLKILESMETGLYPLLDLTIKNAKKRALDLNKNG